MTPRETSIEIVQEVARHHGVTVDDIMGRSKRPHIVKARQASYAAMRHRRGLSYPQIGHWFNRDHSTVIHGIKKHGERATAIPGITAGLI